MNPCGALIVVLTMYKGDEDIHRALEAGASAYVLKTTVSDDLVRVVREVVKQVAPANVEHRANGNERAESDILTEAPVENRRAQRAALAEEGDVSRQRVAGGGTRRHFIHAVEGIHSAIGTFRHDIVRQVGQQLFRGGHSRGGFVVVFGPLLLGVVN